MGVVTSLKARSKMRQEDFVPLYNPGRETTQVLSRLNFDALRTQIKKHPSLLPSPHLGAQRPGGGRSTSSNRRRHRTFCPGRILIRVLQACQALPRGVL